MKKMLALVVITSFLLSGCVVVPAIPHGHVVISGEGAPSHCPPGQAKEGRC